MKKALIAGNLVLLAIVVVMSGFWRKPSPDKDKVMPPVSYKSCYDCGNDTFYGITVEQFMTGVARYRATHAYRINHEPYMEHDSMKDARACWYSLDTLEKYICLIKKYSEGRGLKPDELGIRFYYAVYPSDAADLANPKYISHHTLFMVPTYDTLGNNENVDFDPRQGLQPLASYFSKKNTGPASGAQMRVTILDLGGQQRNAQQMAKNQGQLCPPNCPPAVVTTLEAIDQAYPHEGYNQQ
jgi:hypothetical protein